MSALLSLPDELVVMILHHSLPSEILHPDHHKTLSIRGYDYAYRKDFLPYLSVSKRFQHLAQDAFFGVYIHQIEINMHWFAYIPPPVITSSLSVPFDEPGSSASEWYAKIRRLRIRVRTAWLRNLEQVLAEVPKLFQNERFSVLKEVEVCFDWAMADEAVESEALGFKVRRFLSERREMFGKRASVKVRARAVDRSWLEYVL